MQQRLLQNDAKVYLLKEFGSGAAESIGMEFF